MKREAHLIALAIEGPEIAGAHLAVTGAAGLDRRLVHGFDAGLADRGELGGVDGFEQTDRSLCQLREPGAADRDAGGRQALVLAIQRQVPGELVHQETGDETHIRAAAFQNADRGRQGQDLRRSLELDHRATILEHVIRTRALGNPVGDLLADDFVLIGREALDIGVDQRDGLDRHLGLVEEGQFLAVLCAIGLVNTTGMGGDRAGLLHRRGGYREGLAQVQLAGIGLRGEAFAL